MQRPDLSDEDIRTTTTIFLLLTGVIALVLYLSAAGIARSYEDARLEGYLKIGALCLISESVASPIQALYRRGMRFDMLAVLNVAQTVVGTSVPILLAVFGWSYLSLALGWLAAAVVKTVLALILYGDLAIFRPCLVNGGSCLLSVR